MIYRSHAPAPPLSHFIELLWYYEGLTSPHQREKLLPDGSMELVIDLTEVPKKLHDSASPERFTLFRKCWISGMQPGFLIIGNEPDSSMMGAHFRTGGAFPFFGFPLAELASQVVELDLVWKRDVLALRERLLEQPTIEAKFARLKAFLTERARQRLRTDRAVDFALSELASSPSLPVRELASRIGLSQKSLIARFNHRVGLAPKLVSRVYRFQRAVEAVARKRFDDWAALAVECGYYDQAHFNHEFRQFSGLRPTEYLSRGPSSNLLSWVAAD